MKRREFLGLGLLVPGAMMVLTSNDRPATVERLPPTGPWDEDVGVYRVTLNPPIGGVSQLECCEGDAAGYGWSVCHRGIWLDDGPAWNVVGRDTLAEVWRVAGIAMEKAGVYRVV